MPTATVLYIDDNLVGPHLRLIRLVCDPTSTSKPHITVRFSEILPVPREYYHVNVRTLDLINPGTFTDAAARTSKWMTVFVRATSDFLKHLEYKPDYPTSEFHITLYNGKSRAFGGQLLDVLSAFPWHFRVPLPRGTKLEDIVVGGKKKKKKDILTYPDDLQTLFFSITKSELNYDYLIDLTDGERLKFIHKICENLTHATRRFARVRNLPEVGNLFPQLEHESSLEAQSGDVHITPPELAKEIAEYTVKLIRKDERPIHFGDPAVGTGAFFSALLRVVKPNEIASAIGVDINREQVMTAHRRWSYEKMEVHLGDYLHMERLPHRTLILANPPYLRHQEIPSTYKKELRERASVVTGMEVSGYSGLYVYFLLLSHAWMDENALAAWLVPSTFMEANYGNVVRYYLTSKVQLIRIHQFEHNDPQFENAYVTPTVVVFRNRTPDPKGIVRMSIGGTLAKPRETYEMPLAKLAAEDRWFIPPREAQRVKKNQICIGDLFTVRRGIATGANDFFIKTMEEAEGLHIPKKFLKPILPKARQLESEVIEAYADGSPKVDPRLYVIDCDLPEEVIRERFPRFYKYLLSLPEDVRERNLLRRRQLWYQQEQREPAPFVCTYMGRMHGRSSSIRFIWNRSNAIVTNTYIMLYPKSDLQVLLDSSPSRYPQIFSLLIKTESESLSRNWRTHAGGLVKIEPGDLRDVALSSTPAWIEKLRLERRSLYD